MALTTLQVLALAPLVLPVVLVLALVLGLLPRRTNTCPTPHGGG